jgi:hypothetical protein
MIKTGTGKWGLTVMFLIIGIFVFSAKMTYASQWVKIYDCGGDNDTIGYIQQTSDGGYIAAGGTTSFGAGSYDAWVLKLDNTGNVVWQKSYGGTEGEEHALSSIQQTADGGYIVAGWAESFSSSGDAWILKLDGSGNVQWQKTYGGTSWDDAESIQQTADGGYIVAGWAGSFSSSNDVWVLKLDSSGNVQWQKTYGGTSSEYAESIQQTADGGYIVAGWAGSFSGSNDVWVLKLDANGNIVWQRAYGGINSYYTSSIQQTSDGGYVAAGESAFDAGSSDAWVLKLDGSGNVQWQKTYGGYGSDHAYSIQQTSDGGYVAAGESESFGAGSSDAWVLKLDGSGNVQWQKTYGSSTANESVASIQQTSDGGYIVPVVTASFSGDADAWVLKLDGNGNIHGCSLMRTSNAQVSNTDATVQDTTVTGVDTNVSPQTSTASVLNTNAVVTELCKYGCNLVPDTTSVHRGGTFGFQATGTNYSNNTGSVFFATKVTKPDGNLSGFLFGPRSVYWGSYESKSGHLSHTIPSNAPLGLYTYYGYIGNYGIGNYSKCQFDFTVTDQGQGCNLCHQ